MNYSKAIEAVKRAREADLFNGQQIYFSALTSFPELKEADTAYRKATLEAIKTGDYSCANQKKDALDDLLRSLELWDKVYPRPRCSKCNDTGFVGKAVCDCVKALTVGDDLISFPLHGFDQIDVSLFEGKNAQAFFDATAVMRVAFEKKFPDTKKRIFSLVGKSGTGKTYLASCCASAVLSKGKSVVFLTAFGVISRALKYHTTFDDGKESYLQPILDCDLLIIDDLGTEAIYKNVTLEYLYLIINERQLKGKHTMITSNLTLDQIKNRYGERIASRILDNKTCYIKEFDFEDIRKII